MGMAERFTAERFTGDDPWSGWRRHARGLKPPSERLAALERRDG